MLNLPLLCTTHTLTHMPTHTHTQTPMRSHTPLPHKDTHPGPAQKANEDGQGGGGELSLAELGAGISKQSWFRNAGNVDSRPFPAEVGEGRWGQASGPWEREWGGLDWAGAGAWGRGKATDWQHQARKRPEKAEESLGVPAQASFPPPQRPGPLPPSLERKSRQQRLQGPRCLEGPGQPS